MKQVIALPWPPAKLSPNARLHWAALAHAKKRYRAGCAALARASGLKPMAASALHLSLTFFPPTRRPYDLDNALARMKAGLDGLSEVLGVDDQKWSLSIAKGADIGGYVVVEISEVSHG